MKSSLFKFLAFVVLSPVAALAQFYSFELVTAPGYTHSSAHGIDNSGSIIFTVDSNSASFLRDPSGTLTPISDPGHTPTVALGMNNLGSIVGDFWNSQTSTYIGFIRAADGTFSEIIYPGAVGSGNGMGVYDVNDSGVTVGSFATSTERGAFIRLSTGEFESFQFMDRPLTSASGVNNAGFVVGHSRPDPFSVVSSFLRHPDGTFDPIAYPGAFETQAFDINNSGQIVGQFNIIATHGFVRESDGTFNVVQVPGSQHTTVSAINDTGEIAGYAVIDGRNYAFIGTPVPEPSSCLFLALGTCLALTRRSKPSRA
jgi:hypothetical protein